VYVYYVTVITLSHNTSAVMCFYTIIYTIIKTTSVGDARLSVVGVADWLAGDGGCG